MTLLTYFWFNSRVLLSEPIINYLNAKLRSQHLSLLPPFCESAWEKIMVDGRRNFNQESKFTYFLLIHRPIAWIFDWPAVGEVVCEYFTYIYILARYTSDIRTSNFSMNFRKYTLYRHAQMHSLTHLIYSLQK